MIPLHRPPFGLGSALASCLRGGERRSLQRLEEAYTEASGGPWAVWLPSARAGIGWALRAAIQGQTRVIGPAFTCPVVHEAMVRSGGSVRLLDPGSDHFLMPASAIAELANGNYALVLSEVYGHMYDLAELERKAAFAPVVRVVDMAMSVPDAGLFRRLGARDFGVISFGNGKSMYTGWGGMGFAADRALADEVRRLRDLTLAQAGPGLALRRAALVGLRTAAHYPLVYGVTLRLWYQTGPLLAKVRGRLRRQRPPSAPAPAPPATAQFPAAWSDPRTCAPEWRLPSTHVDRGLALWNLERAESFHAARCALAGRYAQNLEGVKGIVRPRMSPGALSHYTVRLDAGVRNLVKQRLWQGGVYTISLWTFPQHLDPHQFPAACRVSSEVINLPLSPWMSARQVDGVCELLARSVETCSRE